MPSYRASRLQERISHHRIGIPHPKHLQRSSYLDWGILDPQDCVIGVSSFMMIMSVTLSKFIHKLPNRIIKLHWQRTYRISHSPYNRRSLPVMRKVLGEKRHLLWLLDRHIPKKLLDRVIWHCTRPMQQLMLGDHSRARCSWKYQTLRSHF